jgi:hypothetical protein
MPEYPTPLMPELFMVVSLSISVIQMILLGAVVYLLWKYVQAVRQVQTIGQFWVKHWNDPQGNGVKARQKSTVVTHVYEEGGPWLR